MELPRCPSPEAVASYITSHIKSNCTDGHVCNFNTCNIINLNVEIHENGGKFAIKTKYLPPLPWKSTELVETIYSIYICKNTGKIHYCHINCDGERKMNDDNCEICCISGIQYQSESVRSWKVSARCVPSVIANKTDPYKFSRNKNGRVKPSGVHNLKLTECILVAREFIHNLLFSSLRMKNEEHKVNDLKRDAEKTVNKYKRYCERNKIPKNYIHMITMYISKVKNKHRFIHLIKKPPEEKEKILNTLSKLLIATWKMVVFKTTMGIRTPSMFPFKTFVPACLFIMKNGLGMGGIYIIDKSRYLESALPEANTLDLYSIAKPSFTQTKNNIFKAVRETVEQREESPQSLRLYIDTEIKKI